DGLDGPADVPQATAPSVSMTRGASFIAKMLRALIAHPGADEAAVPRDHLLLLVRRKDRSDHVDKQLVELGPGDVLDDELAHRGQRSGAELLVRLDLDVRVRETAVFDDLLP